MDDPVIRWLLEGDVSIQYQVRRNLLGETCADLRARIATEGWGARYLAARNADGTWGKGFYQPKWTSSHYTLLELRRLCAPPDHPAIRNSIAAILDAEKRGDGGVGPGKTVKVSDVCVNGMVLNYASYFGAPEDELASVVDFLLAEHMPDGGFNCRSNRAGARHSSMHSTLSVLKGFEGFRRAGHRHRHAEIEAAAAAAREFLLIHRLFKSDRTGRVIHPEFLRFRVPPRWKYDILRALDHFVDAGVGHDRRMEDALSHIRAKRRRDGRWNAYAPEPGLAYFRMEPPGHPSRWITYQALRVLNTLGPRGR